MLESLYKIQATQLAMTGSQSTATNYQSCDMWLATVQFQIKLDFSHTHLTSAHHLAHHLACIDTADLTQPVPTIIAHCTLVLIHFSLYIGLDITHCSLVLIQHFSLVIAHWVACILYSNSDSDHLLVLIHHACPERKHLPACLY